MKSVTHAVVLVVWHVALERDVCAIWKCASVALGLGLLAVLPRAEVGRSAAVVDTHFFRSCGPASGVCCQQSFSRHLVRGRGVSFFSCPHVRDSQRLPPGRHVFLGSPLFLPPCGFKNEGLSRGTGCILASVISIVFGGFRPLQAAFLFVGTAPVYW